MENGGEGVKDLETIFREHRIACDRGVICPLEDWNAIASQVSDLEAINAEMRAMLDLIKACEITNGDVKGWSSEIKALLEKVRGKS